MNTIIAEYKLQNGTFIQAPFTGNTIQDCLAQIQAVVGYSLTYGYRITKFAGTQVNEFNFLKL